MTVLGDWRQPVWGIASDRFRARRGDVNPDYRSTVGAGALAREGQAGGMRSCETPNGAMGRAGYWVSRMCMGMPS